MPRWQSAYVMGYCRDGPVKVGIALNPKERLRQLQTGNPRQLNLYWELECGPPGGIPAARLEPAVHRILENRRLTGEWFDVPVEVAVCALIIARESQAYSGYDDVGLAHWTESLGLPGADHLSTALTDYLRQLRIERSEPFDDEEVEARATA